MSKRRVIATIEGRIASTRLPGKILYPLAGVPMIGQIAQRIRRALRVDEVVIATTDSPADQVVVDLGQRLGVRVHCGPVEDISERLRGATEGADIVVQITGDCPLVDPSLVDAAVELLEREQADYVSNSLNACTYPIGFDVRAFTKEALIRSMALSDDPIDRVHGSYFIARRPDLFRHAGWDAPSALRYDGLRLTVDEPADYELVHRIYEALAAQNPEFGIADVIALLRQHPSWTQINATVRQKQVVEG